MYINVNQCSEQKNTPSIWPVHAQLVAENDDIGIDFQLHFVLQKWFRSFDQLSDQLLPKLLDQLRSSVSYVPMWRIPLSSGHSICLKLPAVLFKRNLTGLSMTRFLHKTSVRSWTLKVHCQTDFWCTNHFTTGGHLVVNLNQNGFSKCWTLTELSLNFRHEAFAMKLSLWKFPRDVRDVRCCIEFWTYSTLLIKKLIAFEDFCFRANCSTIRLKSLESARSKWFPAILWISSPAYYRRLAEYFWWIAIEGTNLASSSIGHRQTASCWPETSSSDFE